MEYTQFMVGWKSSCPPPHDSREEFGGELHSVCEAEKRMLSPMKKLYTPRGVESQIKERGVCSLSRKW